jgi:ubiquinone/menaquinone biosynthesis C-methylase UbiE
MHTRESTVSKCKSIRKRIYDRSQFPHAVFEREVLKLVCPESIIVDVGCGREAQFVRRMSSQVKKAYGVDLEIPETAVEGNIELMYGDAEAIPLQDHSVDLITMYDVVEHLRNPERVFLECKRILKPGGSLVLTTPNKLYPPIVLGRVLGHRVRQWINRISTGTGEQDTFPAYYKANSGGALRRLGSWAGLNVVSLRHLTYHPEYCMFSTLLYRFAVAVERLVLSREAFWCFRHNIFCQLRSPGEMDACQMQDAAMSGRADGSSSG